MLLDIEVAADLDKRLSSGGKGKGASSSDCARDPFVRSHY